MGSIIFFSDKIEDAKLASLIKDGDEDAFDFLKSRYEYLLQVIAKNFACEAIGLGYDDVYQEASLALLRAAKSFDDTKKTSFRSYASTCVKRSIVTAYRNITSQKNIPFKNFLPLDRIYGISRNDSDPQDTFLTKERAEEILNRMHTRLSYSEESCMILFMSGKKYREIGDILNMNPKAVSNALQRARNKIKD